MRYLIVALLAITVYLNTLGHGFVFDDRKFIVFNTFIQDWRSLFRIFTYDYLMHTWDDLDVNRPLMVISLILDYSIWKLNPMGYHLTNLVLHVANTITFLYLLNLISVGNRIALISSIIFAIHPVHVQAVNAINFREDLMVTFFYLLSLICFIRGLNSGVGKRDFIWSLLFYLLALLSKETALTLPIICLLYIITWKKGSPPKWVFAGYIFVTAIYLLFLLYARHLSGGMMVYYEASLLERLYGSLVILGRYLWLHIIPIGLTADYDAKPFFELTLKNILSALAMFILFIWFLRRFTIKPGLVSFSFAWFFITLIPAMNLIPLLKPAAERYLYLPSIGVITLIAIWASSLLDKKRKPIVGVLSTLIVIFSVLTINGNTVWKDNYSLWHDTVRKAPKNSSAHRQLGLIYEEKKQFTKAYIEYQAALKFAPENLFYKATVHDDLGLLYLTTGKHEKAYEEFGIALKLYPEYYEAHINLGSLYAENSKYEEALREYQSALRLNPDDDNIHYRLGMLYAKNKQYDRAYSEYQKTLELNPKNASAYFDLGLLLFENSNIEASIAMFNKGLTISPGNVKAHSFLGDLYMKIGKKELAEKEYKEAARLGLGRRH